MSCIHVNMLLINSNSNSEDDVLLDLVRSMYHLRALTGQGGREPDGGSSTIGPSSAACGAAESSTAGTKGPQTAAGGERGELMQTLSTDIVDATQLR